METPTAARREEIAKRRFPWLEWLLLLAGQGLFFQVFPSTWTRLMAVIEQTVNSICAILDVRNWNAFGDIIGLAVVLGVLLLLKNWKDRGNWAAEVKRWSDSRRRM